MLSDDEKQAIIDYVIGDDGKGFMRHIGFNVPFEKIMDISDYSVKVIRWFQSLGMEDYKADEAKNRAKDMVGYLCINNSLNKPY